MIPPPPTFYRYEIINNPDLKLEVWFIQVAQAVIPAIPHAEANSRSVRVTDGDPPTQSINSTGV